MRATRRSLPEFYEETIALSAVAPRMTVEQVRALRKKVGRPVYDTLFSRRGR
jgi:hypothetical protein